MGGEKNLEGFEEAGGLSGSGEDVLNLVLMAGSHGGDDGFFVCKIAIDKADADSGFGADIVHTGLVEAAFGEADQGGIKDLLWSIVSDGVCAELGHWLLP